MYNFAILCQDIYFSSKMKRNRPSTDPLLSCFENRAGCEIMWKGTVEPSRSLMTIWRMRIVRCLLKATNTHPQYVILIVFPLQQLMQERNSILRYMYSAFLFYFSIASK